MNRPLYTLGPERRVNVFGTDWLSMRLHEDQRKSVVFLGYPDGTPGKGGIQCVGTGFFLACEGRGYLVTAKHVAYQLGDDPFLIRVNKKDGTSENLHADNVHWIDHPDPTVDVALVPMHIPSISQYDVMYLGHVGHRVPKDNLDQEAIGVGSPTYTVGLFRLLSGEKRNLPICHSGIVALVPSDEKIPVIDWTDPLGKRVIFVEGYLVETQGLSGLSGSPVFVRTQYDIDFTGLLKFSDRVQRQTDNTDVAAPRCQVRLLGVWQAAWEAPPDEVRSVQTGSAVKVPVGMGIVVPYYRIEEMLEMQEVKEERKNIIWASSSPATPQSADRVSAEVPPDTDANPKHREDFSRLLDAAVKRPKQDD